MTASLVMSCDREGCKRTLTWVGWTPSSGLRMSPTVARQYGFARYGWTRTTKGDFCPDHTPNRKKKESDVRVQ